MVASPNFRFDPPSFLTKNGIVNIVKQLGLNPKTLIGVGGQPLWSPRRATSAALKNALCPAVVTIRAGGHGWIGVHTQIGTSGRGARQGIANMNCEQKGVRDHETVAVRVSPREGVQPRSD